MFFAQILAIGILCVIAFVAVLRRNRGRVYPLPLPPGPRRLPLLGNVLQLDTKRPWLTYTAWGKTYGKLVYTRLLGIDMVVLNSETVARELLDKRSAIYSDRPVIRTSQLSGLDFSTALLPYASLSYREMYSQRTNELVANLLNTTIDPHEHIHSCLTTLIFTVTYGHTIHRVGDPTIARGYELADIAKRIITPEKAALLAAFPFLEKLPTWCFGGDYALFGRSRELCQQLLNEPFNEVKARMAEGTASQSLVADFLSQTHDDDDEGMMRAAALTGYLAGIETSTSAVYTFILVMTLYPDVQAQARAEINQVAVLREVLRWCPPLPLGVAHATSQDDVYDGFFIPKGALVVVNQWALSRDEDTYPDASRFDPNRHLTAEGKLKDRTFNHFAFGNGRRICPGRWFAENSVWIAMAAILSVLRIDYARDPDGHRIEIKPEFTTGAEIQPKPFQCSFESVNTTRERQLPAVIHSK
ncbi:cytochrome P450 [Rhizopogon vinicolor AM-OR11-026]|uniref:Cytochrome P450 n=1 Tax=Rhizopogon vinicolor AM-OR11-026 TaxID=1314800 RepID=A0A1B7NCD8_9AGAM|nr:cytochrome P450 [Rhizopogon vinicolor AM-OR11-026]